MSNVLFSVPAVDENGPVFSSGALPDNPALEQASASRFAGQPTDAELEAEYQRLYGPKATPAPIMKPYRCWTRRFNQDMAVLLVPGAGKVEALLVHLQRAAASEADGVRIFNLLCDAETESRAFARMSKPDYGKAFVKLYDREVEVFRKAAAMGIPAIKPIRRNVRKLNPAAWPKQSA